MSVHYSETEYAFISAKVRSLENGLVTRDQFVRMAMAEDTSAAIAVLRESGIVMKNGASATSREDVLLSVLKDGLDAVKSGLPDPAVLGVLEYPYDCSNIKSAIKCGFRGIDPAPLLFNVGSIDPDAVVSCVKNRDFSLLPRNMALGAEEAVRTFGKTGNPQVIDLILDKACFLDIAECAKTSRIPFIVRYCEAKADLTNFMICLRVLRMHCGEYGGILLNDAVVAGGRIVAEAFRTAYTNGEEALFDLVGAKYTYLTERCAAGCELELAERVCDNYCLNLAKAGKKATMGIEVPFAYILALENEVKNVRIILAGKDANLAGDTITERLRDCYV